MSQSPQDAAYTQLYARIRQLVLDARQAVSRAVAPLLLNELESPFVRRATITLRRSLGKLVTAIETDSLDELVETTKKSELPLISSNFCEALTHFEDESLRNSVDIGIAWAASIPRPANEPTVSVVRVQHDYLFTRQQLDS